MVLLSKAAIQRTGESVYVRVYIPIEIAAKLGLSEANPYIMWTPQFGSMVIAQPFPLSAAKELLMKQQQQVPHTKQTKILPKQRESIDIDIL